MNAESLLALAGATIVFALIPGPGVMAIVAQALARGFRPAVLWTAGQAAGDMVYLLTALLGLGWIAAQLGDGFVVLRYAGAAYLVWMGLRAWMAKPPASLAAGAPPAPRAGGRFFLGGMCVSLGNPKAIAFYCGFLPAFVDMTALTPVRVGIIVAVILPIVLLVPVGYAWVAARGRRAVRSTRLWTVANRGAGTVMIGCGVAVAAE
ncbi:LysE family translocator [Desulfocurvus sp.]|uniref:LysE family translocator n=1 Tax=Desulfocurvus sp. TaxID=2871698 RepID=UPI0025BD4B65|nr:LysE family translocator [Desulfocurvus sp.]MCK9239409.1 LysE family translocator [Desulfocurvus sp.]